MKYQHCVLLPISLFLIVAGIVSLLLLGMGNLEPYTHTKDFRQATCTVVYTNRSGEVPCTRYGEDKPASVLHHSLYPCVSVFVNYTELIMEYNSGYYDSKKSVDLDSTGLVNGSKGDALDALSTQQSDKHELVSAKNVMLYDTYSSWSMRRTGEANSTCSIHVCHKNTKDNEYDVTDFSDDYGTVGDNFRCYFNPTNTAEVFANVVTGNNVMHAFVWPGLAMGFGVFLLVVVAFLSCEVWICRNPKRAQRRMQGQIYQLASYRAGTGHDQQSSRRGWREGDLNVEGQEVRPKGRRGDGNNNSRLPNLSAAADIIRKWSFRNRSDRRNRPTDTNRSSQSYAGNPSHRWTAERTEKNFSTT